MQEYERFISEMVKHCCCRAENCPCDGVLAGGMCDMDIEEEEQPDENDEEWGAFREVFLLSYDRSAGGGR